MACIYPDKFFDLKLYTDFSSATIWSAKKVKVRKVLKAVIFIYHTFLPIASGDTHSTAFGEKDILFHS